MGSSYVIITLSTLYVVAAYNTQSYIVSQDRVTRSPGRLRFTTLTSSELLRRVTAESTPLPTEVSEPKKVLISSYEVIKNRELYKDIPSSEKLAGIEEPDKNVSAGNRSYRKQYGRPTQQSEKSPNNAANLKDFLKHSGTLSLSELLQRNNISLSELLQSKKLAISVLSEQQRSSTEKASEASEKTSTWTENVPVLPNQQIEMAHDRLHMTNSRPTRYPALFRTNQRSSYLQSKRVASTTSTPSNYDAGKKGDSREDILELLQPGSPVSLATILSSRNMTLAELMEHRERGSKQQQLVELFQNIFRNPVVQHEPGTNHSSSKNNVRSATNTKLNKGSRDPRLLGLPRRNHLIPTLDEEKFVDVSRDEMTTKNVDDLHTKHIANDAMYDYVDEEQEYAMPVAVKSAILASGGLLVITLIIFAVIFICCKFQQTKRRRSAKLLFINASKLSKSERSVVIKPTQNSTNNNFMEF